MSSVQWGRPSYPNPCLVPGCSRPRHAYGLCKAHRARLEQYGSAFEDIPIGSLHVAEHRGHPGPHASYHRAFDRAMDGPYFCVCATTRPNGIGVCVTCGYKSVARMTHRNAETAYVRYPRLRTQPVEPA